MGKEEIARAITSPYSSFGKLIGGDRRHPGSPLEKQSVGCSSLSKSVIPVVKIPLNIAKSDNVKLIVDTGAEISLIKETSLKSDVYVNKSKVLKINSINGQTTTLGTCEGKFLTKSPLSCEFQVIKNNDLIKQDGILGTNFLFQHCNIEGASSRLVFPRTETNSESFYIPLENGSSTMSELVKKNTNLSKVSKKVGLLGDTRNITDDFVTPIDTEPHTQPKSDNENTTLRENMPAAFGIINFVIPPRSEVIAPIRISSNDESLCLAKEIQQGVFIGSCLIRPENAAISIINVNEYSVELNNYCLNLESSKNYVIRDLNDNKDIIEHMLKKDCEDKKCINRNKHDQYVLENEKINKSKHNTIKNNQIFYIKEVENDKKCKEERVNKILTMAQIPQNLNNEEKDSLFTLLYDFEDIFHLPGDKLTYTESIQHDIPVKEDQIPVNQKMYRLPYAQREIINEQISQMKKDGIIENSKSPWNSPLLVVPKRAGRDGEKRWRVVVDFRKLNEVTIGDAFPLPRIEDILDQLGHSRYYTTLDLASGFHQIKVNEKDKEKTAFSTPDGHFQFTRMPFGLKGAPATFQRLMTYVLSGMSGLRSWAYIDDLLIIAKNLNNHSEKLREIFERLRRHNLKLQPEKCCFLQREIVYLGHKCTIEGVQPDPSRVKCMQEFPVPKNLKKVQSFLGLANYYRKFIPNFSDIAAPINKLLRKDVKFEWNHDCQKSFEKLKEALTTPPLLRYPDFNKPFILTTDASNEGLGAVLSQGEVGEDLPIAYASRSLKEHEKRYSTIEKELLAIVWAVKNYRCYLYGRKFIVYTDHKPLRGQVNIKDPTNRILQMRHKLSEYDFKIDYKPGKNNVIADTLSRILHTNTTDITKESGNCLVITRGKAKVIKKHDEANINTESQEKQTEVAHLKNDNVETQQTGSVATKEESKSNVKLLTEPEEIQTILNNYHNLPLGGHQGVFKTYNNIKRHFKWKNMMQDIKKYIEKCESCQKNKVGKEHKMPMEISNTPYKPFEKTYMDIVGPLPETLNGNKYILSFEDDLTKFMDVVAIPDIESKTVAKSFFEEIICRYLIPQTLITDQGTNFTSQMFRDVCKLLKIKKIETTPYHPQANGSLERSHRPLIDYLRSFVDKNPHTWDEHLRSAMFVRNNSVHSATKLSPNDCLFGFTAKIPDNLTKQPQPIYDHENYFLCLRNKLQSAYQIARENLIKAKHTSKQYYDEKINPIKFHIGDQVLLRNAARKNKLSAHWTGPHEVITINSPVNTTILIGNRKRRIHNNRLKLFK